MISFLKENTAFSSPQTHDIEILIMLFADDIILLSATIAGLHNQITALYNAAHRLRLQVNLNKTKVMFSRKGGSPFCQRKMVLWHWRLEVANTYRYLGLTFWTRLSFKIATDGEHTTRAKRGTINILKTLRRLNCFSPGLFFKLFDAQIVPSLLYGSELWGFEPYQWRCGKSAHTSLYTSAECPVVYPKRHGPRWLGKISAICKQCR